MKRLLLGVHNHQPVGNFKHVFDHSFERSYKPFLDILYEYPHFKFTMHTTGPLWEYFESEHPEYIELIREMVSRGQLELVVSGYYEPVLASIPHEDRVEQIKLAKQYVKNRFKYNSVGLWLTERVWESEILKSLCEAGIKYVVVDDFHFLSAGKSKEELHGYYLTESEGETLAIFPIDETLRYLIPFREVDQAINYIKNIPGEMAIIFDDGEKFGLWPGTYEWVYEKGWLRRFIEEILSSDEIKTTTYSEALKEFPPLGRIYLPTASYFEMGEWSLPAGGAVDFIEFVNKLRQEGIFDRYRRFVRGGIWKNFLVKYEEANNMHKKMIFLSRELRKKAPKSLKTEDYLFRAQCNDAYWHGVFGGLYLPHLRKEIYSNLVKVDALLDTPDKDVGDINKDGLTEIYLKNKSMRVSIIPHLGGSVYEISNFKFAYNFQDTLSRRFEHYHKGVKIGEPPKEGVASIHEHEKWISPESAKEMVYDNYPRYSYFVHFLPKNVNFEDIRYNRYSELGDFIKGSFKYRFEGDALKLMRDGYVHLERPVETKVSKLIKLGKNSLDFVTQVNTKERIDCLIAMEFNIKFEVPEIVDSGERKQIHHMDYLYRDSRVLEIIDEILGLRFRIESSLTGDIYVYPILTISQSERGFDLVYQGSSIFVILPFDAKKFNNRIKMEFIGG